MFSFSYCKRSSRLPVSEWIAWHQRGIIIVCRWLLTKKFEVWNIIFLIPEPEDRRF